MQVPISLFALDWYLLTYNRQARRRCTEGCILIRGFYKWLERPACSFCQRSGVECQVCPSIFEIDFRQDVVRYRLTFPVSTGQSSGYDKEI